MPTAGTTRGGPQRAADRDARSRRGAATRRGCAWPPRAGSHGRAGAGSRTGARVTWPPPARPAGARSASSASTSTSSTRRIRARRWPPACARWPRSSGTAWSSRSASATSRSAQLREALEVAPIAAVQVELSPWQDASLRGGVVELCARRGHPRCSPIVRWAARTNAAAPGAGSRAARRSPTRHGASPADVVLAWLRGLSRGDRALPGPTRSGDARRARPRRCPSSADDIAATGRAFPGRALLRVPRDAAPSAGHAPGDVVLVMGTAGSGEEHDGGRAGRAGLRAPQPRRGGGPPGRPPARARRAAGRGPRRVVLDNTYLTRAAATR